MVNLAHSEIRKVGRQGEEAEKLNIAQRRLQVLIIHGDSLVRHVIVRRDASEVGRLQLPRLSLVPKQLGLVEERGGGVVSAVEMDVKTKPETPTM